MTNKNNTLELKILPKVVLRAPRPKLLRVTTSCNYCYQGNKSLNSLNLAGETLSSDSTPSHHYYNTPPPPPSPNFNAIDLGNGTRGTIDFSRPCFPPDSIYRPAIPAPLPVITDSR
jgi:hypothetical protein